MRGIFEVDLRIFAENVRKIRAFLPKNISYFSVIKADAYGLGLEKIVRFVDKNLASSIQGFAVANVWEAQKIRTLGSMLPIIILSPMLTAEVAELRESNAVPMVSSRQEIDQLEQYAAEKNSDQEIQIAIDTGMGRAGVWYKDLGNFLEYVRTAGQHLKITGYGTHYASIETDPQQTIEQHERFLSVIPKNSPQTAMLHASSSFGIDKFADGTNTVRIGILQYGYPETDPLVKKLHLKSVASLKGFVVLIKSLPRGVKVGYEATCQLKRDTKIALLSVGYADGISRDMSGSVLIRGHRCPTLGLVSMDTITVDVTDLPEVSVGDEVVFWGSQGGDTISLDEFSRFSKCNYRLCTSYLSDRIERKYIE